MAQNIETNKNPLSSRKEKESISNLPDLPTGRINSANYFSANPSYNSGTNNEIIKTETKVQHKVIKIIDLQGQDD